MKKKMVVIILFIFISLPPSACASQFFEEALSGKIKSEGVFENGHGIIYADKVTFESVSLLIVSAEEGAIKCEVYDDTDGLQLTDSITFSSEIYPSCRIGIAKNSGRDYIFFSHPNKNDFYTVENDAFTSADIKDYFSVNYIAGYENAKIVSFVPKNNIYNFFNRLKEESISSYSLANKINSISEDETIKIKTMLSACADIMSFDIKEYDYDSLFKYILYTHENFRVLTDIPPNSGKSSSLGYNNVSVVNSEFIDYVMEKVFRITPEKPPVNNLLSRGFCYNDGYYLYTGGFEVYFATDVKDLIGVYDLGGDVIFVIFSDIYREGNSEIPEYSFAVMQKTHEGYSMLRLGMGENMPSQEEVRAYSPFSAYGGTAWNRTNNSESAGEARGGFLLPVLLIVFSVGTVGLVCSIIVLARTKRK